jgi:hypothetical protein
MHKIATKAGTIALGTDFPVEEVKNRWQHHSHEAKL